MFYQGDLHSGISKAVQESKLVACFVTDDGEESQLWEREFLGEPTVKQLFSNQTVLLRLVAPSQEAKYLAEIVPVPKTPTLVVIKNGELKEYITSGTSKDEFLRRIGLLLVPSNQGGATPSATSADTENNVSVPPVQQHQPLPQTDAIPSSSAQTRDIASPVEAQGSVQGDRAERNTASGTSNKKQEVEKSKKQNPEESPGEQRPGEKNTSNPKNAADTKYALLQKKRQKEARDERARILERVENDKLARRAAEARRKAHAAKAKDEPENNVTATPRSSKQSSTQPSECALQFRFFDGSTARSRFPSQASLGGEVRSWIKENQKEDVPYTFKQVLTPLPNKDISISEEKESLQSLGLLPSATLILVPVNDYTRAYDGGSSSGFLSRGVSAIYSFISAIISLIASFLGGILWAEPTIMDEEPTEDPSPATAPSSRINVRTLRGQQAGQEDQQFYNGNALNFEPRRDDEDEKDA